jgi:murein DD-endopeptidase MepM/ murein hydrolase activator NlpD
MPVDYRAIAKQKAEKYGLLPEVFLRQITQESGFNPNVKSPAGAIGIAQIMPGTASDWGVNPNDPVASLDAAARNMADYIKTYGGNTTKDPVRVRSAYEKALQAYNAGPGSVGKYLPAETKNYISEIIGPDKFSFTNALGAKASSSNDSNTNNPNTNKPPAPNVTPVSIPRFDFKGALEDIVRKFAGQSVSQNTPDKSSEYLALADQLENSDTVSEENMALADQLRAKAIASAGAVEEASSVRPEQLALNLLETKIKQTLYDREAEKLELALNTKPSSTSTAATVSSAPATPQKGISLPGVVITSPVDTSGEPGFDFVIPGGRGAEFKLPFEAQVLKVVGNQNWETNLEKGPGKRGYGNHVEVRGVDPNTGKQFDVLLAHFDKLNSGLKPGIRIGAGTVIGTQGRTGSTTGPHVSADFYDPGKNSTSSDILNIGYAIRDRLAKGQPVL